MKTNKRPDPFGRLKKRKVTCISCRGGYSNLGVETLSEVKVETGGNL